MTADRPTAQPGAWRRGRARGQVFVIFALGLVGLVGMLGLVLDGGVLYLQRRTAQNGADAAALAGAYALNQYRIAGGTGNDATVAAAICRYALANRAGPAPTATAWYVDSNNANVGAIALTLDCTGTQPPSGVPSSAVGAYVTVTIGPYNTYLVGIVGVGQLKARADATASISSAVVPQTVVVLNGAICPGLTVNTTSHLTVANGGIQVNSACSTGALQVSGASTVQANQGAVTVVGTAQATGGSTITPAAVTGVAPIADPLAGLPIPNLNGLPTQPAVYCQNGATMTIGPGVYQYIAALTGCNLTMLQGNYVVGFSYGSPTFRIDGGSKVTIGSSAGNTTIVLTNGMYLCCSTGSARPVGTNVLFYNACLNYLSDLPGGCHAGDQFGAITWTGGIDLSLVTPQTSGPYQYMTVFQDRNNAHVMTIDTGVVANAGTVYGKTMPVSITGSVAAPVQFIVDSLAITGSSTVTDTVNLAQKNPGARLIGMTQ